MYTNRIELVARISEGLPLVRQLAEFRVVRLFGIILYKKQLSEWRNF